MVVTGAKSEDDSKLASRKYARIIQKLGFNAKTLVLAPPGTPKLIFQSPSSRRPTSPPSPLSPHSYRVAEFRYFQHSILCFFGLKNSGKKPNKTLRRKEKFLPRGFSIFAETRSLQPQVCIFATLFQERR
jgi:hypothetical protein